MSPIWSRNSCVKPTHIWPSLHPPPKRGFFWFLRVSVFMTVPAKVFHQAESPHIYYFLGWLFSMSVLTPVGPEAALPSLTQVPE